MKYNVVITRNDGRRGLLFHRNRVEWTLKTAKKHATEYIQRHANAMRADVIHEADPIHASTPVFTIKAA